VAERGRISMRAVALLLLAARLRPCVPLRAGKVAAQRAKYASLDRLPALVLNADYAPLSFLPLSVMSWRDAVTASLRGSVDVVATYPVAVRSARAAFDVPSVVALRRFERRARAAAPTYSKRLLLLRDGYTCQYCGAPGSAATLTADHVVPRAVGGATTWDNVVACCAACNEKKRALLPSQLKSVGMVTPTPARPSAHQLEAAARKRCLHDLEGKDIHDSWKVHLGCG